MKENKKIEESTHKLFDNALHIEFHQQMFALATSLDTQKTNIPRDLTNEWLENIADEIQINREVYAIIETQQLIELDTQCNQTISFILSTVDNARFSPLKIQRDAYQPLYTLLRPYRNAQNKTCDKETILIYKLISDCQKTSAKNYVTALSLTDVITQLAEQNEAYSALRTNCVDTRTLIAVESSKTVRPRTDANCQQACELIYASQLLTGDTNVAQELSTLIDRMNHVIAKFKVIYNQNTRPQNRERSKE